MFGLLVKLIFWIVGKIGDIILAPFMLFANAFIPNFSDFSTGIINFFNNGLQYVGFIFSVFHIPSYCVTAVTTLLSLYVAFKVGFGVYKVVLLIYDKFKP